MLINISVAILLRLSRLNTVHLSLIIDDDYLDQIKKTSKVPNDLLENVIKKYIMACCERWKLKGGVEEYKSKSPILSKKQASNEKLILTNSKKLIIL